MLILAGDVGGTSTRLRLTRFISDKLFQIVGEEIFFNDQFVSFTEIVALFLKQQLTLPAQVNATCFAAAGPIIEGSVKFTNLPWFVSEAELSQVLKLQNVTLINDFEAIGYGIDTLDIKDYEVLQVGETNFKRPRAMIGAGTGLGVAISIPEGNGFRVMPTEGGHVDFAPTEEMQIKLLQYLKKKWHRVSVERLLSGQGILNIYSFVRQNPLFSEVEHPTLKRLLFTKENAPQNITEYAIQHHDPLAMRTLDLFIGIYGAAAGNLALTTLPFAGLYIVGGIAPKLLTQFLDGRFLNAFSDKGRMSNLLKTIPIYLVTNTQVGLQGAANYGYLKLCKI